jgi:hypothetical protein
MAWDRTCGKLAEVLFVRSAYSGVLSPRGCVVELAVVVVLVAVMDVAVVVVRVVMVVVVVVVVLVVVTRFFSHVQPPCARSHIRFREG